VGNVSRTFGATLGVALLVTAVTHFAEIEMGKARIEASKTIMSSTVFTQEVKDTLSSKINVVRFSKNNRIPTEKDIIGIFEKRRDDAVVKAPAMMKPAVKKVYEKQIGEMSLVYRVIKKSFLNHVGSAFSITYKISGIALIIGLLFAFICEPRRKTALK